MQNWKDSSTDIPEQRSEEFNSVSPDSAKMTFCSLCQCHYHLFPAKKKVYERDLSQNKLPVTKLF